MTTTNTEELSPELAGEFRRLADTQTARTRPWPGVDTAIRRSHRRRISLTAAGLTVVIAAGAGAISLVLHPHPADNANDLASMPTESARPATHEDPEAFTEAGLTGATGGSLGQDTAFLEDLRARVPVLIPGPDGPQPGSDVLVLWAGDIEGQRIALIGYRPTSLQRLTLAVQALVGDEGSAANSMNLDDPATINTLTGLDLTAPFSFVVRSRQNPGRGVVLMFAPRARTVELATTRSSEPGKDPVETWKPLIKQGGTVWVGTADATARSVNMVRVDGVDTLPAGAMTSTGGSSTNP